ncbi:hypothetical protein [Pseudogulbenkiania ferrooxidans]|uniref:Uncharacterized protein n=1 Tax=Pseudogulbenkiania ferrooxidans 2002 TaxID=279714 RepID=B9Z4Y5_9NEIS|nr:hypothetical protein [Pseudogulbenkiania ferrooxidans]EEG08217.1 conserved hypothetical protein [Pseudogulbenkiania ferrooxidans 2002]
MFFAKVDQQGIVEAAFMGSGVDPDGLVEIGEDDYIRIRSGGAFHIVDGEVVALPPEPIVLAELLTQRLVDINTHAASLLATLSASYPDGEVQSWAQQTREAEALVADPVASTPLLTAIATARGLTVATLAERVRAKVLSYAVASGQIIGQRQALEDALMAVDLAAPDAAEQLAAIQWPEPSLT